MFFLITTIALLLNCDDQKKQEFVDSKKSHLYFYKTSDILDFLKQLKYTNKDIFDIKRNSLGTSLYFFKRYAKENTILVLSDIGKIKKLVAPGRVAYLNDQEKSVVWFDDLKKGISFLNGDIRHVSKFGRFGVDPSGRYCFLEVEPGLTEIVSTDNPKKRLSFANLIGRAIFQKNDKILLFDYDSKYYAEHSQQRKIICQIFQKSGSNYEFEEEINIPRPSPRPSPFSVIDIDPWSDNVLVLDKVDPPLSTLSSHYLFNLRTKQMEKVGHGEEIAFFLKDDILRKK